jgi:hypothetical protein
MHSIFSAFTESGNPRAFFFAYPDEALNHFRLGLFHQALVDLTFSPFVNQYDFSKVR